MTLHVEPNEEDRMAADENETKTTERRSRAGVNRLSPENHGGVEVDTPVTNVKVENRARGRAEQ